MGKTIARLEERLGFRPCNRTTGHMRLTADGEACLAACSAATRSYRFNRPCPRAIRY
ncbi:LysR family transcriptional regulator [Sphingobium sp. AR-3-1]|uniref:LysR family transcriptional regulator n=1 Tax=Sphingobium psychrophilum TaxID=2728834 RepID=A0A7X9ZSR7_9SPHN|nr:LysR family transcriptional regulator [Sphingobium psychrophilum]